MVASQYLAGLILTAWLKADPREVSPFLIARYAYYYGGAPHLRRRLWICSAGGLGVIALVTLPFLLPQRRAMHGDARFATRREIHRAGLFSPQGIFLGRHGRRYLVLEGQQGVIASAPPRSDKGTAIVVPNCLSWPGSLICQDIKLENWHLTAGYRRRMGQPCYLVNPLDPKGNTARSNPLSYVSKDPNLRVSGIQRIAASLFPEVPGTDPFWTAGGRGMLLGLALYVLETPSLPPTLGEVLRQGMASDAEGFSAHWKRIIGGRQSGRAPLSAPCVRAISDIIDLAPVTASSIRKTFTSRLDLFANPLIDAATSANDFDWRDARRRPMSIFLGIQPGDLNLLRPLLNLYLEQAIACQTEELPEHNPALKYQVLMLLDEMTAPGRIPILAQAISYLPGYNVRFLLIIQAYSQLREVYGVNAADTMMKSLAARIVYAPKDIAEATEISNELGNKTVKARTHSRPVVGFTNGKSNRSRSVSVSEQRRPLLLPQEVKELGKDREIIFYEGIRPILARKNRYYRDPLFKKRLFAPPTSAHPLRKPGSGQTPPNDEENTIVLTMADSLREDSISPAPPGREATLHDIDNLENITLEDFEADFSAVTLPEGPLTDRDLSQAADSFLQSLRER